MENPGKKADLLTNLRHRLKDPFQLRAFITALMVIGGYAGIYMNLDSDIAATTAQLAREQKRLALAKDIEKLRAEFAKIRPRLSDHPDPNEWRLYLLDGIRKYPVNLVTMDTDSPRDVGPFKAVVLKFEFEGTFLNLNAVLRWLETNPRLCRVDNVTLSPHGTDKHLLVMKLTLLGVMG